MSALKMNAEQIHDFLNNYFPRANRFPTKIESISEDEIRIRLIYDDRFLRPGGTISGPILMTLADTVFFYHILAHLGPVAMAVTSSLSIDFLRRPKAEDVLAIGTMLKLGRRLAVGRVEMFSDKQLVACANVTYSIPNQRSDPETVSK